MNVWEYITDIPKYMHSCRINNYNVDDNNNYNNNSVSIKVI